MAITVEASSCIASEIIAAAGNGEVHRLRKFCIEGFKGKGVQPINQWNVQGHTPLMAACLRGELEAVRFCLENGAPVNVQDMCKMTALMIACCESRLEIVKALLEHKDEKIQLELGDLNGRTALHYAVARGSPTSIEIVKLLLKAGADVNTQKERRGETPLILLAKAGHRSMVQFLLKDGKADVDLQTNDTLETGLLHTLILSLQI